MPTVPKRAVYGRAEMPPPVRVRPPEEEREAKEAPPLKVEEAVEVTRNEPSVTASPEERRREVKDKPPDQVEVAVEVLRREPPEIERPPVTPKADAVIPPVYEEVAAPVTEMRGVMMEEVAERPETVVEPEMETWPATAKAVPGVVVPTPTLPEIFSMTNLPD